MTAWLLRSTIIVSALASSTFAGEATPRTFEFEYRVSVAATAGRAKVWVPVPQNTAFQKVVHQAIETEQQHRFVTEETYGNRFVLIESDGGPIDAVLTYAVERWPRTESVKVESLSNANPALYLVASHMIILNGKVADEAARIAGDAGSSYDKARRLYDNIVDTVTYDKSGEGWGRGDAAYACDARAGNCTDFHSLFIGEARSLGVPSRFLMGFSIPHDASFGNISGYHCWAEFYLDGKGWMPIDASEASKDKTRRDELFGRLDCDRLQFTMGRDLVLPEMQGEPLNFAIYPYVEVDGKPYEGVKYSFAYRDVQ